MSPILQRPFNKLRGETSALLSRFETWPDERMRFRPEPSSWSTLDVMDHLFKVEHGTVIAVRGNLPEGHPISVTDRIGAAMVGMAMRLPVRVKVPAAAKQTLPDTKADRAEIVRRWRENQDKMADLLNGLSPSQLKCGLLQHPVSGWLDISQTLKFLSTHLNHHEFQLERIRRAMPPLTQPASS